MATGKRGGRGIKDRNLSDSAGIRPFKLDLQYATEAAFLTAKGASGENLATAEEGDFFYDTTTDSLKVYNGTAWIEQGDDISAVAQLANTKVWIGDASGVAQEFAISGDATMTAGGVLTVADVTVGSDATGDLQYKSSATALARLGKGTAGDILQQNAGATAPQWATVSGDATIADAGAVTIANDAVNEAKTADSDGTSGLYVKKTALALYDFSTDGGSQGAITLTDAVTIPDNAVCTAVTYDVLTTCTSSGDAATIKLNLVTDGDLSTAIAINDGTNPWDAGVHLASVITPIAQKTTAARLVQITVAGGQDLTAGKIVFAIDYYVSQ